ncbi:MAG: GNAT family N-acetyltransferase [Candidatus Bathyarchaeota archaeon]|nr:MAG: GNAT family N-acetyltransferase [Candidatus Bathyarchaeota archaeon]
MSTQIRLARPDDHQAVANLYLEFSGWPLERHGSIQTAIENPDEELFVAESEGQVVGFIHQVYYNDPLHAGLNSNLTSLYVKMGYKRRGIGSQLVQQALDHARRRNVVEVHVTTRETNLDAIKFYEANAFSREGVLFEINP